VRPILKPEDADYKYPAPLDTQNDLVTALKLLDVGKFKTNGPIYKEFKLKPGEKPTAYQVLDGLLRLVLWETTAPTTDADKESQAWLSAGSDAIDRHLSKAYVTARDPLIATLGQFCCYCDSALSTRPDVEHVAPKSSYPLFTLSWENFLLACPFCNSDNKGTWPSRERMDGWSYAPYDDEVDRYDAIRRRNLWPDLHSNTYTDLMPQLEYRATNASPWVAVDPPADSVRKDMVMFPPDHKTRIVTAQLALLDPTTQARTSQTVEVRVTFAAVGSKARNAIRLLGLNKEGTESEATDTRMFQRTQAWFEIVTTMRRAVKSPKKNWPVMLANVRSKGQFTLWVRVLQLLGGQDQNWPGSQTTFSQQFLTDTDLSQLFPNTDTSELPK
jgi:hypothetical protein